MMHAATWPTWLRLALARMVLLQLLGMSQTCCSAGPGLASAGCDLSVPDFARLLFRTRAFYKEGLFELPDALRVNRIIEGRETLKESCPAAVLQAILLKLEENLVYEPQAMEALLSVYTTYLHDAIRRGMIGQSEMRDWGLEAGLERVQVIREKLSVKKNLSSAM
ncbi:unnamed protein product, partial [Polarella glacialis]